MAKVRRDAKGRVLRKGESYRKSQKLYAYSYTDPFGKRQFIYDKDLIGLRKKEDQLKKDQLDGLDIYVMGKADLNFTFDRYMSTKRNLRETTRSNYLYQYDQYVRDSVGHRMISQLKYSDILCFYESLLDTRGLSINTVDGVNTILCSTFDMAVKDDIIRKNPAAGAMKDLRREYTDSSEKRIALTLSQQRAFVSCLDWPQNVRWKPLFITMLGTGGRIGEIIGLRWCDVNYGEGVIDINHTVSYFKDRTGDKRCKFVVSKPKTDAGVRTIPILDEVREALNMEQKQQRMTGIKCKSVVDGYKGFIFCNRFGELLKPNGVNKVLHRIIADYNASEEILAKKEKREPLLLPDFSNHSLRHTFCTRLCEKESNLKVIQYVMGHKDIQTTMNIYADVTKDCAKESFRKFSDNVSLF